MSKRLELIGVRFHYLVVVDFSHIDSHKDSWWNCICDCGNSVCVRGYCLNKEQTKSCGCYHVERTIQTRTIHGQSKKGKETPEYNCWLGIKRRCYKPKRKDYNNYGGRGITVCQEWLDSFEQFYKDMGEKPEPKKNYSIDRINNDDNYESDNCKWSTRSEQNINQRRNKKTQMKDNTTLITYYINMELKTKIKLAQDRILVLADPEVTEEKSEGGVYYANPKITNNYRGTVIASGVGYFETGCGFIPNTLKPGDRILYGKFSYDTIELDGMELLMMRERDIKAQIDL